MALQPNFTFEQQSNCKEVLFNDTTGVYANPGNLGGYGTPPNIASSAVTFAQLEIKKSTWDNPIYVNYTIATNVITNAVVVDQFGSPRNVFSQITNPTFPFVNQSLDSEFLYDTTQQDDLEVGTYFVTYNVSNGTTTYSVQKWIFFVCQFASCVQEAGIKYANKQLPTSKFEEILLAFEMLFLNVGLQNVSSAQLQIDALNQLCTECGCCS